MRKKVSSFGYPIERPSWASFADYIFDSGWFDDSGNRPKTVAAIRHFCLNPKVTDEEVNALTELEDENHDRISLVVFAPDPNQRGETMPLVRVSKRPLGIIYLSPELERYAQSSVNRTVAHEFAHVLLGHYKPEHPDKKVPGFKGEWYRDLPAEKAVHELLAKWGYEKGGHR
jgi:hypothetical protein